MRAHAGKQISQATCDLKDAEANTFAKDLSDFKIEDRKTRWNCKTRDSKTNKTAVDKTSVGIKQGKQLVLQPNDVLSQCQDALNAPQDGESKGSVKQTKKTMADNMADCTVTATERTTLSAIKEFVGSLVNAWEKDINSDGAAAETKSRGCTWDKLPREGKVHESSAKIGDKVLTTIAEIDARLGDEQTANGDKKVHREAPRDETA